MFESIWGWGYQPKEGGSETEAKPPKDGTGLCGPRKEINLIVENESENNKKEFLEKRVTELEREMEGLKKKMKLLEDTISLCKGRRKKNASID